MPAPSLPEQEAPPHASWLRVGLTTESAELLSAEMYCARVRPGTYEIMRASVAATMGVACEVPDTLR